MITGLGENGAKAVLSKVFAAVEFMHSEGLVHRQIRAEHVLIYDPGKFNRVKISDFLDSGEILVDAGEAYRIWSDTAS